MIGPVTRRVALATGGAFAIASPGSAAVSPRTDPLDGEALFTDLARYAAYGPKHTGSAADRAISAWLAQEAVAAGAQARLRPFRVRQFALERAVLVVEGVSLEVQPFWYPKPTNGVLTAPLTLDPAQARGRCLVSILTEGLQGVREMRVRAAEAGRVGAAALVLVVRTPSGESYGHMQAAECAVPTLITGERGLPVLQAAALRGGSARLEIAGRFDPTSIGDNVIATISRPGPLFVVTTPTSAWTTAGGERGPGVALWLGLLRRAASGRGNWLFGAFSGHELDGAGSRAFLAGPDAPKAADVAAWCHLGASIANRRFTRDGEQNVPQNSMSPGERLLTNKPEWLAALSRESEGVFPRAQLSSADQAVGEMKLYFSAGYPTFGFEGAGWFFHGPGDTERSTTPQLLAATGRALEAFFSSLAV